MCWCVNLRISCELSMCNVGLRVVEVAHDIQAQVSKYVKETLGLVNSYDTWHGTVIHVFPTACYVFVSKLIIMTTRRNKECGQGDEEDHRRPKEGEGEEVVPTACG